MEYLNFSQFGYGEHSGPYMRDYFNSSSMTPRYAWPDGWRSYDYDPDLGMYYQFGVFSTFRPY